MVTKNKQIIKRVGEELRKIRRERDLTQEYLAFRLSYKDKSSYAKLERGEVDSCDLGLLVFICNILDISIIDLLKRCSIS